MGVQEQVWGCSAPHRPLQVLSGLSPAALRSSHSAAQLGGLALAAVLLSDCPPSAPWAQTQDSGQLLGQGCRSSHCHLSSHNAPKSPKVSPQGACRGCRTGPKDNG